MFKNNCCHLKFIVTLRYFENHTHCDIYSSSSELLPVKYKTTLSVFEICQMCLKYQL